MPDDHSEVVPLLPIPNRTVKRLSADDSGQLSPVKVGHRQASSISYPPCALHSGGLLLGFSNLSLRPGLKRDFPCFLELCPGLCSRQQSGSSGWIVGDAVQHQRGAVGPLRSSWSAASRVGPLARLAQRWTASTGPSRIRTVGPASAALCRPSSSLPLCRPWRLLSTAGLVGPGIDADAARACLASVWGLVWMQQDRLSPGSMAAWASEFDLHRQSMRLTSLL